jgi:hypothetical protein
MDFNIFLIVISVCIVVMSVASFSKLSIKVATAIAVVAILVLSCNNAKAGSISDCVQDATLKSMLHSGIYGGAILGGGTLLGIAVAPAGTFTVAAGTAVVATNAVLGGLIGVGSSAVTHISLDSYFKGSAIAPACLIKVGEDSYNQLKKSF